MSSGNLKHDFRSNPFSPSLSGIILFIFNIIDKCFVYEHVGSEHSYKNKISNQILLL